MPAELDIHLVLDNYATHKHAKVKRWLAARPRFHLHFTPTYSSWLNQVERWFGLLSQRATKRGSFRSVPDLVSKIQAFIDSYNASATPFAWVATAQSIIDKVARLEARISGTAQGSDRVSAQAAPRPELAVAAGAEQRWCAPTERPPSPSASPRGRAGIDPEADEVDWLLGLGQDGAHMMVLSRDRDTIFTANRESDTLSVVEGAAAGPPDWRVTTVPAGGEYPEGLDLSPDGAELWTATRNDGGVSIVDVAAKAVTERLELGLADPNRLAFTPDGARVLISDSATSVVVMDAALRTEVGRLSLAPNAVLVRPDGAVAFAALRGDDRVAVIDLDTLEVVSEILTGDGSGPGCMFWLTGD